MNRATEQPVGARGSIRQPTSLSRVKATHTIKEFSHQEQRVGKETVDIHSAATEPVACGPTAGPWSASMVLTEGAFQNGTAAATAVTLDAEPWVGSASASRDVKLYRSRR